MIYITSGDYAIILSAMDSSTNKTDVMMKKVPPVMITLYGICCLLWLIMTFTMVGRQIYPQNGMPEAFVFSEDWECDGQLYSMEHISDAPKDSEGRIIATKKLPDNLSNNDQLHFNGKNIQKHTRTQRSFRKEKECCCRECGPEY